MEKLDIRKGFLVSSISLHLFLLWLTQFTAWPEMLAWPYLLTEGWLPYRDIAMAHTPLLISGLSLYYKMFGVGVVQLQLLTWLIIVVADLILYFVTSKLWNKRIASYALIVYIAFNILFQGNGLWFDLILSPLFLLLFYLLNQRKYIYAGIIFAVAFLVKQTSSWIIIPTLIMLYYEGKKDLMSLEKRFVPFFFGAASIVFLFVLVLSLLGILGNFAYWGIEFGIFTLPRLEGQIYLPSVTQIFRSMLPLLPLLLVFFQKSKEIRIITVFGLIASFGVYPRWELFHFLPAIGFFSISIALLLQNMTILKKYYLVGLFILVVALLRNDIFKPVRFYENKVEEVADSVDRLTNENDQIYVLNYWDSIYALSDNTSSVRPLIPYIPWYLEYNNFGAFILTELQQDFPEVIVKGEYMGVLGSYQIEGMDEFIQKYYTPIEKIDNITIYQKNK